MMLENRTLEEQETRRLGESYEIGIKTSLSPHHATAFFPFSVGGGGVKEAGEGNTCHARGDLKIHSF